MFRPIFTFLPPRCSSELSASQRTATSTAFCHKVHKEHRERQRRNFCYGNGKGNDYGKDTETARARAPIVTICVVGSYRQSRLSVTLRAMQACCRSLCSCRWLFAVTKYSPLPLPSFVIFVNFVAKSRCRYPFVLDATFYVATD